MSQIQPISLADNSLGIQEWVTTKEGETFLRHDDVKLTDVKLYNYAGLENLTLGQLANAICVHVGVALEDQSVNKMNIITMNARRLKAAAKVLETVVSGEANYSTVLNMPGYEGMAYAKFLTDVMKFTISTPEQEGQLPELLDTYEKRMKVYAAMKEKVTADATASQQDMVDLQTYMSRRDVAYSTSSNLIRKTGMTIQQTASACK